MGRDELGTYANQRAVVRCLARAVRHLDSYRAREPYAQRGRPWPRALDVAGGNRQGC
jgi:hypothetical protein